MKRLQKKILFSEESELRSVTDILTRDLSQGKLRDERNFTPCYLN
jgi:hypothetical protein